MHCGRRVALDPERDAQEAALEELHDERGWFRGLFANAGNWLPTTIAFLAIYTLLLIFFCPSLIFSGTTTAGGDTGAHHYPAQYLIQELLPNGKLTGWAPGWYAGMPMLTFYFPFPFLLIAILDYFIPYGVAFKLGTISGVFLLPLSVYALGRLWRIRKPFPVIGAGLAAAFLLMERVSDSQYYSIYGGNILSTLAGEFGYMLSFALVFLFLGTVYRGMQKPKLNMLFVANCLLLMALALSHIVTTIVLVGLAPGLLLPHLMSSRPGSERVRPGPASYLAVLGVIAVGVCFALAWRWPTKVLLIGGPLVGAYLLGVLLVSYLLDPDSERARASRRALFYLVGVGVIGFCLSAFWSLPFATNLKWTAHMEWNQLPILGEQIGTGLKIAMGAVGAVGVVTATVLGTYARNTGRRILPMVVIPVLVTGFILLLMPLDSLSDYLIPRNWFIGVLGFGLLGMIFAVIKREKRLLPLLWITVMAFLLYAFMPDGRLWNARMLSFWYFSIYLWAAYGVACTVRLITTIIWTFGRVFGRERDRWVLRIRTQVVWWVLIPVVVLVTAAIAGGTSKVAMGWIQWNYSGYESENKSRSLQYREILDYIETLPSHSRVMVEHESDIIDAMGTPRAFEIIPYWTAADTMEGTLMEASFTASFHFINQRELSERPSNAIIGVAYPPDIDVTRGITHLQLMNIPYFLAVDSSDGTERVIPAVEADPRAEAVATFGEFRLYHISGCSGYVEVMKNEPVRLSVPQEDWRDIAVEWYKNADALDTPLVWDNGEEALERFQSVTPEEAVAPPEVPIEGSRDIINIDFQNDSLSFDTEAIGEPHWIKISYFPNWQVKGAEGPFLASPSMMMVIPTESHVELYYGRTWANTVGQIAEVLAWAVLIGLSLWRLVVWIRNRQGADTAATGPGETMPLAPPPPLSDAPDTDEEQPQR